MPSPLFIENEYRCDDHRWYWRVYRRTVHEPVLVRAGLNREQDEAATAAKMAATEYMNREVIEVD